VFEANYGGEVKSAAFEGGQASYLAELQSVEGAEYLVAIGYPTHALIFVREALENGIYDKFLFVDGTRSQDLVDGIGGELLEGFKGTAPSSDESSNALAAWNEAYQAEHGALPTLPFVREAYDAVIAIALAAEYAGSLEGADIAAALVTIASPGGTVIVPGADSIADGLKAVGDGDDINYEGAATTLDWDAAGDVTSGFVGIWAYQGGEIVDLETVPFTLE